MSAPRSDTASSFARGVFDRLPSGGVPACVALAVYVATGSRSIGYWDSAELAASGAVLGVAHPTGYPLFTLMVRAFGILPTGLSFSHNANLFGALCAATAALLLHRLFLSLWTDARVGALFRLATPSARPSVPDRLAAGTAVLLLAFSRVFWGEGVSLEVYALHLVFLACVSGLFLRALAEPFASGRWHLFAYSLGLSFSHHMMTVLLVPAFLALYFMAAGRGWDAWRRLARAVPAFLLGLTPYLVLPIRAAARPAVNWGDPSSLADFWAHVSAAQYRFKMFSSARLAAGKSLDFLRDLPADFAWVALPFAALGLWILIRRAPRLAAFSALIFAASLAYAVNYDFDDPNFRLHAHVMVALWAAFGLRAALGRLRRPSFAVLACVPLVLMPFDANYRALDRSTDRAVEDYARAALASVEPGALILTGDLEGLAAGGRYLQLAQGERRDVALVGLGILAYPWYAREVEAMHPGALRGVEPELAAYLPERRRVERSGGRDAARDPAYDLAYTRLVRAVLRESVARRPTYVSFIAPEFLQGYHVTPQGLLLRVSADSGLPGLPAPSRPAHPVTAELPYARQVVAGYASAFLNHALYRAGRGEDAEAVRDLQAVLELDPGNVAAREILTGLKR